MPQIGFQVGGVEAIGSVLMPWMNGDSTMFGVRATPSRKLLPAQRRHSPIGRRWRRGSEPSAT
jgi:hypothetical protein